MKKELIEKITSRCLGKIAKEHIKQILSEELPDFQRIDEERINAIHERLHDEKIHRLSTMFSTIQEYNSALPTALVPLPKEMPKDLTRFAMGHDVYEVWDKIISEYGTPANKLQPLPKATPYEFVGLFNESHSPRKIWEWLLSHYGTPEPKPELPTVEELAKEITVVFNQDSYDMMRSIAQHLHDKYSLHNREWWQDLKEGDKFMYAGQVYEYYGYEVNIRGEVTLWGKSTWKFRLSGCTPYTPLTAQDIIAKHNLSEEEVKILREGKCT